MLSKARNGARLGARRGATVRLAGCEARRPEIGAKRRAPFLKARWRMAMKKARHLEINFGPARNGCYKWVGLLWVGL